MQTLLPRTFVGSVFPPSSGCHPPLASLEQGKRKSCRGSADTDCDLLYPVRSASRPWSTFYVLWPNSHTDNSAKDTLDSRYLYRHLQLPGSFHRTRIPKNQLEVFVCKHL
jgi:hypothetical protein